MSIKFDYSKQPGRIAVDRNYNKESEPLVSIITPFYNGGKYIEQTYNCIVNQTFPWFEWLIIDDGSTDEGSLEILKEIEKSDNRIKVYRQDNAGPGAARNWGMKLAKTDFIFPLDADDLIEPTCLEYEYWALYFNPDAAWAYSDSVGFGDQEYTWCVNFDPVKMKEENHVTICAMIRKEKALEVGGYSSIAKKFDEDWHFWLKLIAKGGFPVQIKGDFLFWYRRLETGRFSSVHENKEIALENKRIIAEQAQFVIDPKKAVIYPCDNDAEWKKPVLSTWDRNIYNQKKSKNVLFLFPWLEMGGADKFNLDLIKGIVADGYEVGVITTVPANNEWLQEYREYIQDIFNLPNFLSMKNWAEFISYYIISRQVDIVFVSNSYHGYYIVPWLRKEFPDLVIVDYVHSTPWYWRNGGYSRTAGVLGNILEKTYVCNSSTKNDLIVDFGRKSDSVDVAYIGIDEKKFDREKINSGILNEYGIDSSRPVVLFICRLHPEKRGLLMLEIADRVRKEIPDVAFVVVGDGEQREEIENKIASKNLEDTVYLLGAHNEVRPFYKDSDLLLICSLNEGLALTAYEACAMGVPVVSADVGGQKDLIDESVGALIKRYDDVEKGFGKHSFDEAEIMEYTNSIIRILSDKELSQKLSENCRSKILNGFTISKMIKQFESEFESLLNDNERINKRHEVSNALKTLGNIAEDYLTMELMEQCAEEGHGIRYYNKKEFRGKHSGVINEELEDILLKIDEHESRLNYMYRNYEEVLSRHEEEINKHNDKINYHWEVQKIHEERINELSRNWIVRCIKRILK